MTRAWCAVLLVACSSRGEAPPVAPAGGEARSHDAAAASAARGEARSHDAAAASAAGGEARSHDAAAASAAGGEARSHDAAAQEAPRDPATLAEALAELRARAFGAAADAIARREAQAQPKMKLTAEEALATARATLAVADRAPFAALHAVMPRSTVELARAVRERGVALAEADDIAAYLVRVVAALRFERLDRFDENHAHVTGRAFPEIDYRGEAMTWQSQQRDWTPLGVPDYKTRAHIHAYFVAAEKLPHWAAVYRPRGKMAAVR
ncbi:MAG: hypothetical protein KF773_14990 [Deltaproteobacteria bacterium]|nr:hypothetical protein [Deltaproteobacteria bacterium]